MRRCAWAACVVISACAGSPPEDTRCDESAYQRVPALIERDCAEVRSAWRYKRFVDERVHRRMTVLSTVVDEGDWATVSLLFDAHGVLETACVLEASNPRVLRRAALAARYVGRLRVPEAVARCLAGKRLDSDYLVLQD